MKPKMYALALVSVLALLWLQATVWDIEVSATKRVPPITTPWSPPTLTAIALGACQDSSYSSSWSECPNYQTPTPEGWEAEPVPYLSPWDTNCEVTYPGELICPETIFDTVQGQPIDEPEPTLVPTVMRVGKPRFNR